MADVSLRKIGIVMGYEASRLWRNGADWDQLLELCALFYTLIGDADGIYNPREFNDRLLLGLKGTMSEREAAGIQSRRRSSSPFGSRILSPAAFQTPRICRHYHSHSNCP